MKIAGEHTFEAPRELVWKGLLDPVVLASVMPGCEKLDLVGENQYEGVLNIKVGPVQGKFQGNVKLTDLRPLEGYTMQVDGRGAPGFVNATGKLQLHDQGATTRLTYDADAQVGGRVASVGQRLLDSSARAIIRQSLEGLNATLKAQAVGAEPASAQPEADEGAAAAAPAAPRPQPSQTDFALGVAKEVAKDLVPPQTRAFLAGAAVMLLLVLLYFWLT